MPRCLGWSMSVRASSIPSCATVGRRVPDLLAGDDPLVAVAHRPCPDARQVGTRARFTEQLAPRRLATGDRRDELAICSAVPWSRIVGAASAGGDVARRRSRPRWTPPSTPWIAPSLSGRCAEPAHPDRPRRVRVAGVEEPPPPLADGEVAVPVLVDPRPNLIDQQLEPRVEPRVSSPRGIRRARGDPRRARARRGDAASLPPAGRSRRVASGRTTGAVLPARQRHRRRTRDR